MDSAKVRRDGNSLSESPADEVVARISGRSRRPKSIDAKADPKPANPLATGQEG